LRQVRRVALRCKQSLAAAVLAATLLALAGGPAYADHETRQQVLSESGVDIVLVALVLVGAVIALAAFAAVILWWERRDAKAEEGARLARRTDEEGQAPQT